jgi:hypothetical protein
LEMHLSRLSTEGIAVMKPSATAPTERDREMTRVREQIAKEQARGYGDGILGDLARMRDAETTPLFDLAIELMCSEQDEDAYGHMFRIARALVAVRAEGAAELEATRERVDAADRLWKEYAALANERKKKLTEAKAEGAREERAECAKIADRIGADISPDEGLSPLDTSRAIADAIRARITP